MTPVRLHLLPVLLALAVGFAAPPGSLLAQTPGRDNAVLELPSSTQAMAMGDALDLSGTDSDGIFYNPALLARAAGFMLGGQRFRDAASQLTLSAAHEWYGGGLGVGLQALEWGAAPDSAHLGGVDRLLEDGNAAVAEWAATVGWARTVPWKLAVGAAAKLVGRRIGVERDVVGAVDLGVAREVGPLWLGLSARDLTADALAGDAAGQVPTSVSLAAALRRRPVGPLDVGAAARVTRRDDGEVTAGGGLEVAYWPIQGRTFIGRVGWQTVPEGGAKGLTLGAAFHGDDLIVAYAYRPVDAFGSTEGLHRVSIGWR